MEARPKKLLILYTELAGYTLACLDQFCRTYPSVEIHLVRWPVNQEAPFDFRFSSSVRIYNRRDYDRQSLFALANELQPDAILCSGWIDKDYVRICREWNSRIPVILVMDNKWLGTWKQRLAQLVSRFSILKGFRYAWVPGDSQKQYARRLGFPEQNIRTGFYSADLSFFEKQFEEAAPVKKEKFPHRFIYAGRYYDFKGVQELWDAFVSLKNENINDWELWCLGTGDIPPAEHPAIRHFGFVQPADLPPVLRDTGVFILPSRIEPWGVVVHEFAAAGFPMLLSRNVGASDAFLAEGKNGFSFDTNDPASIRTAMKSVIALSDEQLFRMGELSRELARKISPEQWAKTLYELIGGA